MAMVSSDLTDFQKSLDLDHIYVKGGLSRQAWNRDRSIVRILSWNIGHGRKPEKIAETLAELRPDVACLQEVDWGNERTNSIDVLQHLAERTGMLGLFGIEFLEVCSPLRPAKLAGGGVTGNAVLTNLEPIAVSRVDLPPCLNWELDGHDAAVPKAVGRRVRRERRIGHRFGICAEVPLAGRKLVVCSVHLEDKIGGVRGRWSQYVAAVQAIEASSGTSVIGVIAGDFNTFDCRLARFVAPDDGTTALGKPANVTEASWWKTSLLPCTGYSDPFEPTAWTFSVPPLFRAKLDWITTNTLKIRNFGVGPFSSSDHRPIWTDIDLEIPDT